MSQPLQVAIQGFSAFERSTFEAFFRLSARRSPAYHHTDSLRHCQWVIADGDNPAVIRQVLAEGKLANTLFVGTEAQPGAAAHLRRPINLMVLVKLLDQMQVQAAPQADPPAPRSATPVAEAPPAPAQPSQPQPQAEPQAKSQSQSQSQSQIVLASLAAAHAQIQQARQPVSAPLAPRKLVAVQAPPALPPPSVPTLLPPSPAQSDATVESGARSPMDHILVVDDSDIALRFMTQRLERFGFVVHLSRSGEDALVRTEQQDFAFVFMDVNMPGLDGFKTCKAIKRRPGEAPPMVVMLTSRDTPIDKLRGTMAGCDGYLTKPLDEIELLKIIGDREIKQHAFALTEQIGRDD